MRARKTANAPVQTHVADPSDATRTNETPAAKGSRPKRRSAEDEPERRPLSSPAPVESSLHTEFMIDARAVIAGWLKAMDRPRGQDLTEDTLTAQNALYQARGQSREALDNLFCWHPEQLRESKAPVDLSKEDVDYYRMHVGYAYLSLPLAAGDLKSFATRDLERDLLNLQKNITRLKSDPSSGSKYRSASEELEDTRLALDDLTKLEPLHQRFKKAWIAYVGAKPNDIWSKQIDAEGIFRLFSFEHRVGSPGRALRDALEAIFTAFPKYRDGSFVVWNLENSLALDWTRKKVQSIAQQLAFLDRLPPRAHGQVT